MLSPCRAHSGLRPQVVTRQLTCPWLGERGPRLTALTAAAAPGLHSEQVGKAGLTRGHQVDRRRRCRPPAGPGRGGRVLAEAPLCPRPRVSRFSEELGFPTGDGVACRPGEPLSGTRAPGGRALAGARRPQRGGMATPAGLLAAGGSVSGRTGSGRATPVLTSGWLAPGLGAESCLLPLTSLVPLDASQLLPL